MSSDSAVKIRILFFAKARELAERTEAVFEINNPNILVKDLVNEICEHYNLNNIRENIILAINQNYCEIETDENVTLKNGDEVAVIPPISGG